MRDDLNPIVRVALDVVEVDRAIKIGKLAVQGGVEWIEASTPLTKRMLELGEEGRAASLLEVRLELRGQGVSDDEAGAKKASTTFFNGNISDKNPSNCNFLGRSGCRSEVHRLRLRHEKRKVPYKFFVSEMSCFVNGPKSPTIGVKSI